MMKGLEGIYGLNQIFGHSDTKMSQKYAHFSEQHLSTRTEMLFYGAEEQLSGGVTLILSQHRLRSDSEGKQVSEVFDLTS